jgi:hypothetical protein
MDLSHRAVTLDIFTNIADSWNTTQSAVELRNGLYPGSVYNIHFKYKTANPTQSPDCAAVDT